MSAWSNGMSAWSNGMSAWSNGEEGKSNEGNCTQSGFTPWHNQYPSTWQGCQQTFTPLDNIRHWQQIKLELAHQKLAPSLGKDVVVAVLDTGIDEKHPVFAGRLVQGYDFIDKDSHPEEAQGSNYGHGTAVAGIVLQVAPQANIMPIRVLDGNGVGDTDDIAKGIHYAIKNGANVINLSLGSIQTSKPVLKMIEYAQHQGILVVASTGNTGDQQVTSPAREAVLNGSLEHSLVSVGSVNAYDAKSHFSTYGVERVEMVAPGEFVFSAYPQQGLGYWSGTSFAAPMVSGAIALAFGEHLSVAREDLSAAAGDHSDPDLYMVPINAAKYMNALGKGRLDLEHFLSKVKR